MNNYACENGDNGGGQSPLWWIVAAIAVIVAIALIGYKFYEDHRLELQKQERERAEFVRDSLARVERVRQAAAEQALRDSIAAEERAINDGCYTGIVGGSYCVMNISEKAGTYNMEYDGAERQLRHLQGGTFKAYLHGKYIGDFRGSFHGDTYSGVFVSAKGGSSPFSLAHTELDSGEDQYDDEDGYYNNDPSPNTQSSGSNVPAWLEQAEEKVAEDSQELLAMVRAGRVHPLNVMRIKQAMESNLPQIVSYYSEHGNYEKVAYYRRLAGALDEIFRQLQI
ncbi:MAG: hypothetical protein IJU62_05755 [Muribaculaceae bacterium]|nr:hypothetical protein [Muribaculaceae bacterium]